MTISVFDESWEEVELAMVFAKQHVNYGLTHALTLGEVMQRADDRMLPEWRDRDHITGFLFAAVEALWKEATHV